MLRYACPAALASLCLAAASCSPGGRLAESPDRGGNVLHLAADRIRGFDPVKSGDVASSLAIAKVYEGLLQYAYLERPYRVEPCLCEDMPEVSADGLTYTFRVRRGIYFQDDPCFVSSGGAGRELTAGDFVYSIKRLADLKNASTGYWAFNGRIEGLDEFRAASGGEAPTDYAAAVAGLEAVESHVLRVRLKQPYPQLLWVLCMHYAFAVPEEAVEFYGEDFMYHPVGTGPFVLKSWTPNYRMEFERNPKWAETGRVEYFPGRACPAAEKSGLLECAGKPLPLVDRIVEHVISDSSTQWLMFLQGHIASSGISRDNWDAVITPGRELAGDLAAMGVAMHASPGMSVAYIGFNMDDEVVGRNPNLRRALTHAFNHDEWARFYNNRIMRASGPIPPGVAGHEDKPPTFDLDKARQALAEAGYPDGIDPGTGRRLLLQLDIGSAAEPDVRASVELFVNFMDRIGVVVEPVYNNWPAFLERIRRRQAQMFRISWIADYPDAENFLQLFYGPNRSPGPNHSDYANPEFDALYERARLMPDCGERTALYRSMADIVIGDCPWIFMHYPMSYGLHHGWRTGYYPHDFPYGMAKYHGIDANKLRQWHSRQ